MTKTRGKRKPAKKAKARTKRTPTRRNAPWQDVRELRNARGEIAATLYRGDCREVMAALEAESVHAVVTDPPYELGFMGRTWDAAGGVASQAETWRAAERLLRPGGHLAAFAGSRTYHRIACAIEDAGFEIRDQLMWLYGSGFPKSLDVAKCIDKAGGVWRGRSARALPDDERRAFGQHYERTDKGRPVSAAAQAWDGWGTALKPAHEPIAMARKPFRGTVAANCLAHGTAALNIDACRLDGRERTDYGISGDEGDPNANTYGSRRRVAFNPTRSGEPSQARTYAGNGGTEFHMTPGPRGGDVLGRWPANVLTDGSREVLEAFPPSSRESVRFFYSPKADREEREFGMGGAEERPLNWSSGTKSPGTFQSDGTKKRARNNHPTVKPVDLMAWLCRLLTRPGGTVLDPFTGSGSTGIAAIRHGFRFVGIELDGGEGYFDIATRRIAAAIEEADHAPRLDLDKAPLPPAEQLALFPPATP